MRESIEHPLIPADRVNGTDVYNLAGDKIGAIEDVAIDKVSGNVAYAILGAGGFLGVGEKYFPLPWSLLRYDERQGGYVVPVEMDALKRAPSFDRSQLSGWDDSGYRDSVYDFYRPYGVAPYWGAGVW